MHSILKGFLLAAPPRNAPLLFQIDSRAGAWESSGITQHSKIRVKKWKQKTVGGQAGGLPAPPLRFSINLFRPTMRIRVRHYKLYRNRINKKLLLFFYPVHRYFLSVQIKNKDEIQKGKIFIWVSSENEPTSKKINLSKKQIEDLCTVHIGHIHCAECICTNM